MACWFAGVRVDRDLMGRWLNYRRMGSVPAVHRQQEYSRGMMKKSIVPNGKLWCNMLTFAIHTFNQPPK